MFIGIMSAGDLVAAGVGFSIQDTDADFDDETGELAGYTTVTDELYAAPSEKAEDAAQMAGFYEADEAGSAIEDFAMLDDGAGRWEHVRDGHMAEQLEIAKHERPTPSDDRLDYGAMKYGSLSRERRYNELITYLVKLRIVLRGARRRGNRDAVNRCLGLVSKVRKGINERYKASVKLIVSRGEAAGTESSNWEWYLLYLTKEQRNDILDCAAWVVRR